MRCFALILDLDVETKQHHVAVLCNVFFAFLTHAPGIFSTVFARMFEIIGIGYRLGTNEALLEVAVNTTGGFGGGSTLCHCPSACFFRTAGKKSNEIEKLVSGADNA